MMNCASCGGFLFNEIKVIAFCVTTEEGFSHASPMIKHQQTQQVIRSSASNKRLLQSYRDIPETTLMVIVCDTKNLCSCCNMYLKTPPPLLHHDHDSNVNTLDELGY